MFFRYAHMYRTRVNNRYVLMFEIRKKYYCTLYSIWLLPFAGSHNFRKYLLEIEQIQETVLASSQDTG